MNALYEAVGGLDEENLTVAFNDVDFCLKVMQAGSDDSIEVDIQYEDKILETITAHHFRQDLLKNKIGNGYHAFCYQLKEEISDLDKLNVVIKKSGEKLEMFQLNHQTNKK